MKRRLLIFLSALVLVIPALLIGLMNTEMGSRWLLKSVFSSIPGQQITVKSIEGRLLGQFSLTELKAESNEQKIAIQKFYLSLQPLKLLSGTFKVNEIAINGLEIELIDTKPKEEKPFSLDTDIKLPLQIDLDNLLITNSKIIRKDENHKIDKLQLIVKTEKNQININTLSINSDILNAKATGTVGLTKHLPISLKAKWETVAGENGKWKGMSTFNGDINRLSFDNRLSSPFNIALQGYVEDVLKTPTIKASGDWNNFIWPFSAKPSQIQSRKGHFELAGLLSDYQIKIDAELNQQYLPQTALIFDGNGGLDDLSVNKLEIKSNTGLFNLSGKLSWKNIPTFDFIARGDKFNPAIVIPELPGNLTLDCRIAGKLDPKALEINVDVNKLDGQLRNQALKSKGSFRLNGDQLNVSALYLALGLNKIEAEGELGQTDSTLKFALDMPDLNAFWPSLNGKLKGSGNLQGSLKNPSAQLDIQGKRLQLESVQMENASINVSYFSDSRKLSAFTVSANNINIKTNKINKFSIEGNGTSDQHRLNTDIISQQGTVSLVLNGNLLKNGWKGVISKFDITDADKNLWVLQKNLLLYVEKKAQGFDFAFDKDCLVHKSAFLCAEASYLANGDLNLTFDAKALPTELIKAFLPKQIAISSLINANAELQRKKNVLNGQYQVDLSPTNLVVNVDNRAQDFKFGTSSLKGNIKGDKVSGDLYLNLQDNDYIKGNLLVDAGSSQTLSGRIDASVTDISLFQPFVRQLSELKGQLRADLGLQGTLGKPLITGRMELLGGSVNIGEAEMARVGLRNIQLNAVSAENRINRFQIDATAVPIVLNKPDAAEKINLKSLINLNAYLSWDKTPAGNFSLSLPADTVLTVKTNDTKNKIVLGASSLTGRITGKDINTDLDVALTGQDYLRGKLHINTGTTQSLSGQLNGSIRELALVEMLIPHLSNVKGLITADMSAKGTLQNPLLNGAIKLKSGEADVDEFGLSIREVNLNVLTPIDNPNLIQLKGSAKSGEGIVNLDGKIGLEPALHYPIALTLAGKNFEVSKLPEAQILVSPDLSVTLDDNKKLIAGRLEIPKAILQLNELPENAVKVSEDEVILGEEKPENVTPKTPGIDTDIEIKLGKEVNFKGLGLQTDLSGNLKVIKAGEKTVMQGNVDMVKGSYKRFGQNLTVRKGRFLFNGPTDNPWLDVEAIRLSKSQKVTAILNLTGTLKNPQTRISSEPSLPESEALAYLVTGGPLNQVSKADNNMLASAALSYGAGQATWLTEKLGISEFDVVEGSTLQDTLLVMGQYLTPDFYVGTKIGMFNKQANLVLKHKLTDAINVETQTGTSQRIKLNYEFDSD